MDGTLVNIMSDQIYEPNKPNSLANNDGAAMLGQPFWTSNPVENGETTTLSIPIEYEQGSVVTGEYIGNEDPGQGNGKPMDVKDGHLTVIIIVDLPIGSHPINIRAKDANGQWSSLEPTVLTVMSTPVIAPSAES
jgi:hypothetical protein